MRAHKNKRERVPFFARGKHTSFLAKSIIIIIIAVVGTKKSKGATTTILIMILINKCSSCLSWGAIIIIISY